MNKINIDLPITTEIIKTLKPGDKIFLSGKIITARDAAHKRMIELLDKGEKLPIDLNKYPMYYCGPTPAKSGFPVGACGPTTSSRMDKYVPRLFLEGLRVMIGKGERSAEVMSCIKQNSGLYLVAIGGAGALYAQCVVSCECVLWGDLGAEGVYMMEVSDMPVYVWA